ncbi:MAG: FtsQ-type POTRA domain-containing protein [Candidatus Melainabacteria bacterium]|nr:FtsQ-type POTRA domain-containing protein [Candidatus Melainabacteria bacterium]
MSEDRRQYEQPITDASTAAGAASGAIHDTRSGNDAAPADATASVQLPYRATYESVAQRYARQQSPSPSTNHSLAPGQPSATLTLQRRRQPGPGAEYACEPNQETMMPLSEDPLVQVPPPPKEERRLRTQQQLEMARQRQQTFFQRRREQKRVRVMVHRIKLLVRLGLLLVLSGITVWLSQHPAWVWHIDQWEMSPAQWVEPHQVMPFLRPYESLRLYEIDPNRIEQRLLKQFPVLDQVVVRRSLFPARLSLHLVEKSPWAYVFIASSASTTASNGGTAPAQPVAMFTEPYDWVRLPKPSAFYMGTEALSQSSPARPNQALTATSLSHSGTGGSPSIHISRSLWKAFQQQRPLQQKAWLQRLHESLTQLATHPEFKVELVYWHSWTDIRAQVRDLQSGQLLLLWLGRMDQSLPKRLARLKPLLPTLRQLSQQVDRVDLRWQEQVTLHRRLPEATNSTPTGAASGTSALEALLANPENATETTGLATETPSLTPAATSQSTPPPVAAASIPSVPPEPSSQNTTATPPLAGSPTGSGTTEANQATDR